MKLAKGWGVLLGVPALFVVAYLYPLLPAIGRLRICAVNSFLGCDCPGCGLVRSFAALVRGRIRDSVDLHPLGVIIAAWLIYFFGRSLVETVTGRRLPSLLGQGSRDMLVYAFLAALILQWAVKLWISVS